MRYRKKPVVIEAYQTDKELDIETLEGTMHASVGDYIITGVRGEKYPCKPDIFEQTYEPADASASPWHRVEDELPKDNTWCVFISENKHNFEQYRWIGTYSEEWGFQDDDRFMVDNVKYWMPIEPPKEDA